MAPGILKDTGKMMGSAEAIVKNPVPQFKKGWKNMSNVSGGHAGTMKADSINRSLEKPGFFSKLIHGGEDAARAAKKKQYAHLGTVGNDGKFKLHDQARGFGEAWKEDGVKGVAGALSQRGWTGSGKYTKYIPVGGKGLAAGFTAMSLPGLADAARGEKTWTDAIGDVGANAAYVAAGANPDLGILGNLALSESLIRGAKLPASLIEGAVRGDNVPGKAPARPPYRAVQPAAHYSGV